MTTYVTWHHLAVHSQYKYTRICCPAHALFCPHRLRWPARALDKGKGRDPLEGLGLPLHPPQMHFDEIVDQDYDLFNPWPLLPNPTGPQIQTALRQNSDTAALQAMLHTMEVDNDLSTGQVPPTATPHSCLDPGTAMIPPN